MKIAPNAVHETLRRSMLVDGYPLVFDIAGSHGQYLKDAATGREYLDFFTFFASRPVAFGHPKLQDPAYLARLTEAAGVKPSNCDTYSVPYAEFVETFRRHVMPEGMKHLFFVSGGSLAVENALKAAFDWKVQKNLSRGLGERGHHVVHFEQAFHGRSGYTLSLTNTTDPRKTQYYPKFDWPRIPAPAERFPETPQNLADVEEAESSALQALDEVYERLGEAEIAAIIVEPVQCEGGDRHLRSQFLARLREVADDREALLIFDEVQTGMGSSGTWWISEQLGVQPDLTAFAKRAQTGGVMAGPRLDEVDSVFRVSSRISSTFSGNLVDFVRAQRYVEIVLEDKLLGNAKAEGAFLRQGLEALVRRFPWVDNPRGRGLLLAFDLPNRAVRDELLHETQEEGLLVLGCGERSLRLRPALDVSRADSERALEILECALKKVEPQ